MRSCTNDPLKSTHQDGLNETNMEWKPKIFILGITLQGFSLARSNCPCHL
ncbi:hypothetical protein Sjap_014734 [Stephania japonica]|uniref:Uncharacterized protein n=1 Tax=Stephania japonica TaxID=461633 RepID=A0AAP0IJQ8_9MAGN